MVNKRSIAVVLLLFTVFFLMQGGKVFAGNDFVTSPSVEVFVGDTIDLTKYVPEEYKKFVTYQIGEESVYSSSVSMEPVGKVQAMKAGTAMIDIELQKGLLKKHDTIEVVVCDPQDLSVKYGSDITIDAQEYPLYQGYKIVSDNTSVQIASTGAISVKGFDKASLYIEKSHNNLLKVANVTILQPQFANYVTCRAEGTKSYQPEIRNCKEIPELSVSSSDTSVLQQTGKDTLQAVATGVSRVSATVISECGQKRDLSMDVKVTNPSLKKKKIVMAKGLTESIPVTGTTGSSIVKWDKSSSKKLQIKSDGTIISKKEGVANAKVTIDGKKMSCKVVITNPSIEKKQDVVYLGKKRKISLKGINSKESQVSYSCDDKKVLSITKDGVVKGKKIGEAKIKVVADGKKLTLPITTVSEAAQKAAEMGVSISKTKTTYSQAKRMRGSHYDCSSLVWRCYSKYGEALGGKSKTWAPTAAEIGRWCVNNKKTLSTKSISEDKLMPGDLVFYAYSGNNGRYKHISHIEMYVGNGDNVSASSRHNRVIKYPYSSHLGHIVLVARPTK